MLAGEKTGQADDIHLEAEQLSCSLGIHFSLKAASSTANRSVAGEPAWAQAVQSSTDAERVCRTLFGEGEVTKDEDDLRVHHGGTAPDLPCFCLSQQKLRSAQLGSVELCPLEAP